MSKATGLYDSIWALIGPYIAFAVPISVFILTSFMQEIPREIEESAEIDGCGKIQMFFSMILPLAKPGLATLAIYNGVNMWNEFFICLYLNTVLTEQNSATGNLGISGTVFHEHSNDYGCSYINIASNDYHVHYLSG